VEGRRNVLPVGREKRVSDDLSFKTILSRSPEENEEADKWRLEMLPSEVRLQELEKCFMAVLASHREVRQIQNCLVMEGVKGVKVTTMGDNLVMLRPEEHSSFVLSEVEQHLWWILLFKEVVKWTPNLVAKKRRVWLKCYGIPAHVWEEGCFKRLGNCFGEFVDFDEETITMRRLDVARILVSTSRLEWINDSLLLVVMGESFKVQVVVDGAGTVVEVLLAAEG
jgi:hypothetical protein